MIEVIDGTRLVEADITINGAPLTFAQAMTVRVAIESLAIGLCDDDGPTADGYRNRIEEIRRLIFRNQPRRSGEPDRANMSQDEPER